MHYGAGSAGPESAPADLPKARSGTAILTAERTDRGRPQGPRDGIVGLARGRYQVGFSHASRTSPSWESPQAPADSSACHRTSRCGRAEVDGTSVGEGQGYGERGEALGGGLADHGGQELQGSVGALDGHRIGRSEANRHPRSAPSLLQGPVEQMGCCPNLRTLMPRRARSRQGQDGTAIQDVAQAALFLPHRHYLFRPLVCLVRRLFLAVLCRLPQHLSRVLLLSRCGLPSSPPLLQGSYRGEADGVLHCSSIDRFLRHHGFPPEATVFAIGTGVIDSGNCGNRVRHCACSKVVPGLLLRVLR